MMQISKTEWAIKTLPEFKTPVLRIMTCKNGIIFADNDIEKHVIIERIPAKGYLMSGEAYVIAEHPSPYLGLFNRYINSKNIISVNNAEEMSIIEAFFDLSSLKELDINILVEFKENVVGSIKHTTGSWTQDSMGGHFSGSTTYIDIPIQKGQIMNLFECASYGVYFDTRSLKFDEVLLHIQKEFLLYDPEKEKIIALLNKKAITPNTPMRKIV